MNREHVIVRDGLATFLPGGLAVRRALEAVFEAWAEVEGAVKMSFPPLMRVGDLEKIDYFTSFPHLATPVTRIDRAQLTDVVGGDRGARVIAASKLDGATYVLPSAACYNVYLHLCGQTLDRPLYVTTTAQCFRNEAEYRGLERLWSFSMREIVCVGSREETTAHVARSRTRIHALLSRLGLPFDVEVAADPFFDKNGAKAKMQALFPVKEELRYRGKLALSSVNYHRNFFGDRCDIRLPSGEAASSSCVGFGLERWVHALLEHARGDVNRAILDLEEAARGLS